MLFRFYEQSTFQLIILRIRRNGATELLIGSRMKREISTLFVCWHLMIDLVLNFK